MLEHIGTPVKSDTEVNRSNTNNLFRTILSRVDQ
jgi:hypothetical protein